MHRIGLGRNVVQSQRISCTTGNTAENTRNQMCKQVVWPSMGMSALSEAVCALGTCHRTWQQSTTRPLVVLHLRHRSSRPCLTAVVLGAPRRLLWQHEAHGHRVASRAVTPLKCFLELLRPLVAHDEAGSYAAPRRADGAVLVRAWRRMWVRMFATGSTATGRRQRQPRRHRTGPD